MAVWDRPGFARLAEAAEDRLGIAIRPAARVAELEMREEEFAAIAGEVEDLAFHSLDYFTGRPSELRPERRRRLAQRSRIALMQDPLAGAEAQLLADFAFSKGISAPTARNAKVQDVIDEAWTDANNEEKLTGFIAQRKLSNTLLTDGELFMTLYVKGGRVRVGRLDPDLVDDIVPDPEDRLRPLWYVTRERRYEWDYEQDMPLFTDQQLEHGRPKKTYWKHWRNVDDAIAEREMDDTTGEAPLEMPPEQKIAKGVVFHLPINQVGEQLRGTPPWARSLRFMTAMNVLTEAHVVMAQAASTFIARRAMRGTPNQVTKAASSILSSVSELGAGRLGGAHPTGEEPATRNFTGPDAPEPYAPGSWWNENESSKLEALNLNSGAGQMAQTAQIVRAPVSAAAGFGQHYLGDASNANLATASTLELPATMRVGSWQEFFETICRWFTDRAIEAAVKAGRLGGAEGFDGKKPLGEMRLHEAEDRKAMEDRTDKDLSYEFSMPFPGRRQLPDVQAFVVGMCEAMDPNGVNIPFRKLILKFALEQMGIDDVARAVEECIPEEGIPGGPGPLPKEQPPAVDPTTGLPIPPGLPGAPGGPQANGAQGTAGNPEASPPAGQQPYGAKSQGTVMQQEWIPADLRGVAADYSGETAALFQSLVMNPALIATLQLAAPSPNGAS
jgi:hypothetical protein